MRWLATLTWSDGHSEQHEIEEVSELEDIVEKGPAWREGMTIQITLQYRRKGVTD